MAVGALAAAPANAGRRATPECGSIAVAIAPRIPAGAKMTNEPERQCAGMTANMTALPDRAPDAAEKG